MNKYLKRTTAVLLLVTMLLSNAMLENVFAIEVSKPGQAEQQEVIEEAAIEAETGAGNQGSNFVKQEYLLNYLVVESSYVAAPGVQNIVVSIGEADSAFQAAVLNLKNKTTNQEMQVEATEINGDGIRFQIDFADESQAGSYEVSSITYIADEKEHTIHMADTGIKAGFGVNSEVEELPDAYIITEENASESDLNIVSYDENGNLISEQSIEEALADAKQQSQPGTMLYSLKGKSNYVVVLDPGHDSRHAGTQAGGYSEEKLVLKIARYCKEELERYEGITVYMTREGEACPYGGDKTECNASRVKFAASKKADLFISFHLNSNPKPEPHGAGVYYPNSNYRPDLGEQGKELAEEILSQLNALGLSSWAGGTLIRNSEDGTKYPDGSVADYLGVIRRSKEAGIPAVLIEHAFQSNAGDVSNFLSSDAKLKQLGVADATGIANYLGVTKGFNFKWTNLSASSYEIGTKAQLYYATNSASTVTVQVFYGNNTFLKALVSNKQIGTNDQVITWDLKDQTGEYVENGQYRFTIQATDNNGTTVTRHKYFTVTGYEPFAYKWTNLSAGSYKPGTNAALYYATNRAATVTVQVFYGNNNFLKTLVSNKKVGTNDQVVFWDLKDNTGEYVENGQYRFTIQVKDAKGTTITRHKYFTVTGHDPFAYKWTNLSAESYKPGTNAALYYATNRPATVTVQVFYGNNSFLKTLVSNRQVGTNDQLITWDLKDATGEYVENGQYRFTIQVRDTRGTTITRHKYFNVTGHAPFDYKWVTMGGDSVTGGTDAKLYYAVNRQATIKVEVFYGNNNYMRTLVPNKTVGTNDQVAVWDLTDGNGEYVKAGQYRFTITATDRRGNRKITHKYFTIRNFEIMGSSNTSVEKMMAYYNDHGQYPAFYVSSDAPDLQTFCQIYYEECQAEGVKAEVAFCQTMLETGFLQFGGDVGIEQYNFAGIGATGGGVSGETFPDVRTGIRAQVQHLKAYASKEALVNTCVDPRFALVRRGCAPYVEWLGIQENPTHGGWATGKNYGYSIRDNYIRRLLTY